MIISNIGTIIKNGDYLFLFFTFLLLGLLTPAIGNNTINHAILACQADSFIRGVIMRKHCRNMTYSCNQIQIIQTYYSVRQIGIWVSTGYRMQKEHKSSPSKRS